MSTYVLIHGAWAGSWCWEKVVPLLQQAGHQVVAPDLPGHGQDRTPLGEITLAAYTSRVCEILDAQTEPVILVGHSMGGIVISQVAEVRPEQIVTLVYLAAFLLQHGQTVSQIASVDTDSFLLPTLMVNQEQGYATFKEEAPLKEVLFADCSDEDAARARVRLGPQSLVPFVTPISTTVERFGRVPRVYIECLRDRVISPASQHRMYTALPCQHIISMQTSHSAFFSAPQELVSHLESLSETARVAKEVSDDESTGRARSHPDQTCHWTHAQGHRRGSPRDQAMAYGVPRSTMNESMDLEALAGEALRHLQTLLRCNTTESEAAAIAYLREQLAAEGIDSRIIEPTPSRPSLWARLPGDGAKRPLLLLSHVDVVPVEREQWTMDPFGGGIRDGYIYGRGAIDMKGMLAKQLTLFLHFARCARQPGQRLQRDLLLLSVADEEHGGTHGMQWIAEHEPGLFAPAEFALNEGGGFAFDLGSKRLYVCEVAQKGIAPVTLRARGTPGHGAVPHHGTSAIARLARAIGRVESGPLPLHMTAAMRQFVAAIAATQSPIQRAIVRQLGNPLFSQAVLRLMPNPNALRAMLRNTAVPTVIRAGEAINVVPGEATALLDGRLLPGQTGEMFAAELRRRIADAQVEVQVEVGLLGYEQSAQTPLFSALEAAIAAHDPGALVVPYLFPAVSDARFLVPRGVITYGFDPMKPEPGWPAPQLLAHGHDERISVENVAFGLRVLYDAIKAL